MSSFQVRGRFRLARAVCTLAIALCVMACGCSSDPPEPTSSQPPKDVRGDSTINPMLLELFRGHGVDATIRDGWIVVDDRPRICGAVVRELQSTPTDMTVQLDLYLEVESGRVLVESFAGVGQTRREAAADGMQNLVLNSFHVLFAAFYAEDGGHVETTQWLVNGQQRRVIVGGMGVRGTLPDPDNPPIEWVKTIENAIKASDLTPGTHWVRAYYLQLQSETAAVEVLLDNEVWDTVQAELAGWSWPKCEEYYSVRVFLVIQDSE